MASASDTGLNVDRRTALSNTDVAVKASGGRVYGFHFFNPNTTDAYVQFYNALIADVVVGTTTPDITFWVPASSALDHSYNPPLSFGVAITIAATTTASGGTAPSSGLLTNVFYL